MAGPQVIKVLMVCLGNICRSPSAEGMLRQQVERAGLGGQFLIDSAGTSDWHVGEPPDSRSVQHARLRQIDLSEQRARQVQDQDFVQFDYVLAMDAQNLRDLQERCPPEHLAKLQLFLGTKGVGGYTEVPDPYSGGTEGFELVLDLLETASERWLQTLLLDHAPKQNSEHSHD